ncbi:MAG: choice-of-anchor B family protein [Gemmatimonadales bacterium]|nr:choice-of-anchor B family protein [Gemmatimonadales bacterium]
MPRMLIAAGGAALLLSPLALPAQEPNFGRSMVMTETDLVIGQPVIWYGPGVVYTYRLDAAGSWRERFRVSAPDPGHMDDFGRTVALDGNTMVVGAPRKRAGSGVAYAFRRAAPAGSWELSTTIEPPGPGHHAEFASALVVHGEDLLVGSPAVDSTGVVYHFRRDGDAWRVHDTIRPPAAPGTTGFGRTLTMSGDWLLIGAPAADSGAGRVYAAIRQSDGHWSDPALVPVRRPLAASTAAVGGALLLHGDRAYLGAPGAGAVLVMEREGASGWRSVGELRPFDAPRASQFGFAIAAVGAEVWVGAPGANGGSGRVYRFLPDTRGGWQGVMAIDPDSTSSTSWPYTFGYAIAGTSQRAAISMPQRDFGEGRVLASRRTASGWQPGQQLEGRIYAIGADVTPGARCKDGHIGEFTCANMELVAHMPVSALGGERGAWVNDVWGWTDPLTARDYALIARRDGASFVDVTNPSAPRLVGTLSRTRGVPPSVWRDIKVVNNHAYIVADGAGAHGMQVFDLTRLRRAGEAPVTFTPDTTYHEIFSAHNVVADTANGFVYIVGSNSGGQTCGGGLHMVDVSEPKKPVFKGCYNDQSGSNPRGYTHDAQCLTYRGPDTRYRGRQICVGSNETEINIADVTDKARPVTIGRNSYPNVSYAHQGWFDDEQRYFYMNDEGDELAGVVAGTRTIVWDLAELDDPVVAREYIGPVKSSDHNLFVKGDRVYEANYGSGLRVLDIRDRTNPREIGFFDSAPYNDDGPGHSATQSGAWSNYPFFKSGVIIFTSVREGFFIVKVIDGAPIS